MARTLRTTVGLRVLHTTVGVRAPHGGRPAHSAGSAGTRAFQAGVGRGSVSDMPDEDEERPFKPSLTEARLPSVDHMFNQGMLNIVLDRSLGGPPAGVPRERPGAGLFSNLVRLTDKALREYDAARFELTDYLSAREEIPRRRGIRTSPYIRAVDHVENVLSALARGLSSYDRLQALGYGQDAPRIPGPLREDVVRLRDMIEHADDRLVKKSTKSSRQQFKDEKPYALRLENDFAFIGGWKIDYQDLVTVIAHLYQFIELLRAVKSAGPNHPQSVTRTTVTFIGTPPTQEQAGLHGTDYIWELCRQSVSH